MDQPTFVPAARPVFADEDRSRICSLVDAALQTGSLTLGPRTIEFEDAFAERHGSRSAIAVSSGTAALEIILRSIGVEGRTVVVPANTFFATAAAVIHAGGTPRFADVDPATLALSPATVEAVLDDSCAGVVMVHIGGFVPPAVAEMAALCERRDLFLVEDAAHAHGSSFAGRAAGSFGVAGAFSFYPTKVMTSGEGGMIVTGDESLTSAARVYRDQGKAGFLGGDHVRLGYAWRMSEVHAAIGGVQLARLDEFLSVRRKTAARYDAGLDAIAGITPVAIPPECESNYYKYVALLDPGIDRAEMKRRMRDLGVGMSGEVYASPLHHQPVFAGVAHGPLPVSEDVCARHVCLPVHSDMTEGEADHVVDAVAQVLGALRA